MNLQRLLQIGLCLYIVAVPAATQASAAAGDIGTTPGRSRALVAVAMGLTSVAIGGWALARSSGRTGSGRSWAIVALMMGLIGIFLSGLHLVRSANGIIGTGTGRLGAIVAMALELIGMVLGGLALARSRRNDKAVV